MHDIHSLLMVFVFYHTNTDLLTCKRERQVITSYSQEKSRVRGTKQKTRGIQEPINITKTTGI